jgi:murein DD-endopeptidase MepM/ murein hydrolase activator NlpD
LLLFGWRLYFDTDCGKGQRLIFHTLNDGGPMRADRRTCTFILASHEGSKLLRVSLRYSTLLSIAAVAIAGAVAAGLASYHYGRMLLKVRDYDHLLTENDSFRAENHNYRIQTAQLGEKIDFLETLARKLEIVSGMDAERSVGGSGGYSRESFTQPLPASAGTLKSIDRYNNSVSILSEQYREMSDALWSRVLVESAVPDRMPLRGYVSGGMGIREDPFNEAIKEHHTGLDISAPYGSPVHAPADGIVIFAGQREGYGNIVVIDHKFGLVTRYGHLSKMNVEVGQRVCRSDVIGYVGTSGRTTGPHLHYEVWSNNRPINPKSLITHLENE